MIVQQIIDDSVDRVNCSFGPIWNSDANLKKRTEIIAASLYDVTVSTLRSKATQGLAYCYGTDSSIFLLKGDQSSTEYDFSDGSRQFVWQQHIHESGDNVEQLFIWCTHRHVNQCCNVKPLGPPDDPAGKVFRVFSTSSASTWSASNLVFPVGSYGILWSGEASGCFFFSSSNVLESCWCTLIVGA